MAQILTDYPQEDLARAIVTVKGSRIRVSRRIAAAGSRKSRGS